MTRTPHAFVSTGLALLLVALQPVTVSASTGPKDTHDEPAARPSETRDADPSATPPAAHDAASETKAEPSVRPGEAAPNGPSGSTPPTTVEGALEMGDLTTARKLAVDQRRQHADDPKAWRTEALVHTRMGDLESAIAAWQGSLKALPADAEGERREAEAAITELRLRARGSVSDEPTSTHRGDFDQKRAAAAAPPPAKHEPAGLEPSPAPKEKDRITTKWYFWVTLLAIAASAGAVTGIAIRAATRDEDDAVSVGAVGAGGPALLRF